MRIFIFSEKSLSGHMSVSSIICAGTEQVSAFWYLFCSCTNHVTSAWNVSVCFFYWFGTSLYVSCVVILSIDSWNWVSRSELAFDDFLWGGILKRNAPGLVWNIPSSDLKLNVTPVALYHVFYVCLCVDFISLWHVQMTWKVYLQLLMFISTGGPVSNSFPLGFDHLLSGEGLHVACAWFIYCNASVAQRKEEYCVRTLWVSQWSEVIRWHMTIYAMWEQPTSHQPTGNSPVSRSHHRRSFIWVTQQTWQYEPVPLKQLSNFYELIWKHINLQITATKSLQIRPLYLLFLFSSKPLYVVYNKLASAPCKEV